MRDEPLGLPKGSIRAIMALFILGSVVIAIFMKSEVVDVLTPIAGMVLGYYFGNRSEFGGNANG